MQPRRAAVCVSTDVVDTGGFFCRMALECTCVVGPLYCCITVATPAASVLFLCASGTTKCGKDDTDARDAAGAVDGSDCSFSVGTECVRDVDEGRTSDVDAAGCRTGRGFLVKSL